MDGAKLNPKIDVPARRSQILAEISQEINASLNLDEVLASAAAQIKRLIDYEIFAVLLPDEGTDELYFRFAIGHRAGSGRALAHPHGRRNHRRRRRHGTSRFASAMFATIRAT